jgi:hypothetical protein
MDPFVFLAVLGIAATLWQWRLREGPRARLTARRETIAGLELPWPDDAPLSVSYTPLEPDLGWVTVHWPAMRPPSRLP